MITLLLSLALAADPVSGVRMSRAASLGLGEPTPILGTDTWKAPAPGGFATVAWYPGEAEAREAYAFSSATLRAGLPAAGVGDESLGDDGFVLARRGNLVVTVRGDGAIDRALAIFAAAEAGSSTEVVQLPGIEPRDGFGRRR
ncbi:MAG: hypothetical protein FJ090_01065 [Deltaproteobacteria bacterium]|nr:hypothetical protein [Deltaproteobacteria bacterium]MBM4389683.1 hypothetical protein [Deltaproteobacteria bacterium]